MSAEVVKKRGRPRKVLSDPVELQMPESVKKSASRAKSTKATSKVSAKSTKPKAAVSAEPTRADKSATKTNEAPLSTSKAASKPPQSIAELSPTTQPNSPVTPEASKILSKVRELSRNDTPPPKEADSAKSPKPSPATVASEPSSNLSKTIIAPSAKMKPSTTASIPAGRTKVMDPKPTPDPSAPRAGPPNITEPQGKPKIPFAAMNAEVVSKISEMAGARPNTARSRALPNNYKPVARRVTMAIVALPIAIVTSYVLYQRVVLGEERKSLVPPEFARLETADAQKEEPRNRAESQ